MSRPRVTFETIRVKVSQVGYAEAIQSAAAMGQPLELWAADAIAHHVYRCEILETQQRYQADAVAAQRNNDPTPLQHDERYQVRRPKPQITMTAAQGSGPGGRSWQP